MSILPYPIYKERDQLADTKNGSFMQFSSLLLCRARNTPLARTHPKSLRVKRYNRYRTKKRRALCDTHTKQTVIIMKILLRTIGWAAIFWLLQGGAIISAEEEIGNHCQVDADCPETYGKGSTCDPSTKVCTNPLAQGCLYAHLEGWEGGKRVCNSEDPPNAAQLGICEDASSNPSMLEYMEVRLLGRSWESGNFVNWIYQIVLSEMLGVPSSVESGSYETRLDQNFYQAVPSNNIEYGGGWPYTENYKNSVKYTDCAKASRTEENYEPCAHVNAESWGDGLVDRRELESPDNLGILALQSMYVTRGSFFH